MQTDRGTLIYAVRDSEGLIEVIDHDGTRSLYFGTRARQSSMLLYAPATLALEYTRSMLAGLLFQPRPRRVLMIGLGGGSLARYFLAHFPETVIDCVETRAGVIDMARRYFQLPDTDLLRIHIEDGAKFLHKAPDRHYDLILVDAYDSSGVHPNVCPSSFHTDCRRALTDSGVLSMNLWITPGSGYKTILTDMQQGFDSQVLRLPVEQRANLIALGLCVPHSRKELKALRDPARELMAKYDLDFPKMLRRMEHYNSGLMRRFINLHLR
ncbi:MAG: fused MFS/spermidine synthase [Gammaproteobacteria bacterium]|nr:fused MFS/spermidine synthase [Gammaproteobacteria bacterium]